MAEIKITIIAFLFGELGVVFFSGLVGAALLGIDVGLFLIFSATCFGGILMAVLEAKNWDSKGGGM